VENVFPIFKMSSLLTVHTDSHHNCHNKMILLFPTCDRQLDDYIEVLNVCLVFKINVY